MRPQNVPNTLTKGLVVSGSACDDAIHTSTVRERSTQARLLVTLTVSRQRLTVSLLELSEPKTICVSAARPARSQSHGHASSLLGRTRQRDRIPTSHWQCTQIQPPRPGMSRPCSKSVNITPLQRSVSPPRDSRVERTCDARGAHARHTLRPSCDQVHNWSSPIV